MPSRICGAQALYDINKWNCQLSVPEGCLTAYQSADQWKEFFFVDEKAGDEGIIDNPDTPGSQKCATPTIISEMAARSRRLGLNDE